MCLFCRKNFYICDKIVIYMESVESKIEKVLVENGEGKVYFPCDFLHLGSPKAVSKALQRLSDRDVLMRMGQGIYCTPHYDTEFGMGVIPAGRDAVAQAVARRDGIRLMASAFQAQNYLHMSDQVQMNFVYSTDGPSRKIHLFKGRPIVFIHVPPKIFDYKSHVAQLTVLALLDYGQGKIWPDEMEGLREAYREIPFSEVEADLPKMPRWISKIVRGFYEN